MVLCPYIYLLTRHDVPSPKLQPTEVGSTHWVSIRALLSPSSRTFELANVSDRLARRSGHFVQFILQLMLGQMRFAAVRLTPTESLYCSSAPGFLPPCSAGPTSTTTLSKLTKAFYSGNKAASAASTSKPLLLWGLTLGILADFLETLPPHDALSLWTYPTFTPLDVRFVVWAVTYPLRRRKRIELEAGGGGGSGDNGPTTPAAVEVGLDAISLGRQTGNHNRDQDANKPAEVGIGGLGVGRYYSGLQGGRRGSRSSAVGIMLDGYYELLRRAVFLTFLLRLGVGVGLGWVLWRRYRRRRS